jgi:hypothetical protein
MSSSFIESKSESKDNGRASPEPKGNGIDPNVSNFSMSNNQNDAKKTNSNGNELEVKSYLENQQQHKDDAKPIPEIIAYAKPYSVVRDDAETGSVRSDDSDLSSVSDEHINENASQIPPNSRSSSFSTNTVNTANTGLGTNELEDKLLNGPTPTISPVSSPPVSPRQSIVSNINNNTPQPDKNDVMAKLLEVAITVLANKRPKNPIDQGSAPGSPPKSPTGSYKKILSKIFDFSDVEPKRRADIITTINHEVKGSKTPPFSVIYRPIYDVHTRRIDKYEINMGAVPSIDELKATFTSEEEIKKAIAEIEKLKQSVLEAKNKLEAKA